MVRIAVCDDVKEMLGILTEIVDKEAGKLSEPYEISGFTQGKHLVEEHNKKPFHIIFLDIFMPGMSGFEAAEQIGEINRGPYLILSLQKRSLCLIPLTIIPFILCVRGILRG